MQRYWLCQEEYFESVKNKPWAKKENSKWLRKLKSLELHRAQIHKLHLSLLPGAAASNDRLINRINTVDSLCWDVIHHLIPQIEKKNDRLFILLLIYKMCIISMYNCAHVKNYSCSMGKRFCARRQTIKLLLAHTKCFKCALLVPLNVPIYCKSMPLGLDIYSVYDQLI